MRLAMLEPLQHRDFRLLWIGQSVSQLGNALYFIALPFQIIALGGSALQLGTGFAIFSGAQLVTVLFGGAIVDRLPRRRVILASDLVSGIVVGSVALLGLAGWLRIEHLYIASAFSGVAFSFYAPAISAIMPDLVPTDVLVAGNALRGLAAQSSRVLGPLLGGLVVSTAGPPAAFGIDAATFFFSFVVFLLASPPQREPAKRKSLFSEMRDGVAFVFSVTWIWVSIVGFAFTNAFFFAAMTVALPLLVLKNLGGTAATFGLIGAVGGVGQLVGSLLVGNLRVRRVGIAMYTGQALLGLSVAGYGLVARLPVVLTAAAAFGGSIVYTNTLWESAIQKHVPRDLIGRVTSVDYFGSFLLGPVAPIVAAAAIPRIGIGAIFLISGAIACAFSILALVFTRAIRDLE